MKKLGLQHVFILKKVSIFYGGKFPQIEPNTAKTENILNVFRQFFCTNFVLLLCTKWF